MAPKHHPTPLSGGDRKALNKELGKARAMTNILAAQSAEMRVKAETLLQQADRLLCESWNERMWSDGEPIDPSPTIDQAINGGFSWLEIRCSRCNTPSDVDLAAVKHSPATDADRNDMPRAPLGKRSADDNREFGWHIDRCGCPVAKLSTSIGPFRRVKPHLFRYWKRDERAAARQGDWLIELAVWKTIASGGHPEPVVPPPKLPEAIEAVTNWLVLRSFSAGCTAMTGVEASPICSGLICGRHRGDRGPRAACLRTSEEVQKRNAWGFGFAALARVISVECVGQENADTEEGQQRCYDLDHRRTPWVATMPKTAALRKWR
jgi:hypothetical protein